MMKDELCGSIKYLFGFLALYYVIIPFLKLLFTYTIGRKLLSGRKDMKKAGNWAIVTGATDGIGKGYAKTLAKDGMNIILISRTMSKLKECAAEIESKYGVSTKIIAADFTRTDIYSDISDQLKGLDIGVLVNNVGMGYPHPIYIYDQDVLPDKFLLDMINCNCTSVVMMLRAVLPGMVARGKGGTIINVSSYSGSMPTPLLSLYSASKVFVDFMSRAVDLEIGNRHNIEVQSVKPLFVVSKLSKVRKPSLFIPTPENFVESALDLVNVESQTYGYFTHALQAFIVDLMPEFVRNAVVHNQMQGTMKRALKKKQKSS